MLFFKGYLCVCAIRFLIRMFDKPGFFFFLKQDISEITVRLIFAAGFRGKCWEVSRPQREREADCRVLSPTPQVTGGEKKTAVEKEWVLFRFWGKPPFACTKLQSMPRTAPPIMSIELKVTTAAARYDTTLLSVHDLSYSFSLEFIGPKWKSAEFLKLRVIYMLSNRQAIHCFQKKAPESVWGNFLFIQPLFSPNAVISSVQLFLLAADSNCCHFLVIGLWLGLVVV